MRPLGALLLLACTQAPGPDPTAAALGPWPADPLVLSAFCPSLPYPELITTCRVQAAAGLAGQGDSDAAWAECASLQPGTWLEECHFRAGEELGAAGLTLEALRHCAAAGWFGRFCLTHAGWKLPRDPDLDSSLSPSEVQAAGLELLAAVDAALAGAGDGLEGEGRDIVFARFGFNVYVGSGRADPGPARLSGPLGAALRTGYAIEAARLSGRRDLPGLVALYQGQGAAPTGDRLDEKARVGRYTVPIDSPFERGQPHLPTFGGGRRLVAEDPDEDFMIAALEALFWLGDSPPSAFEPALQDARPKVRWTAARLLRLVPGEPLAQRALLEELAAQHPDENVRWQASDGLRTGSFEQLADPVTRDYPAAPTPSKLSTP